MTIQIMQAKTQIEMDLADDDESLQRPKRMKARQTVGVKYQVHWENNRTKIQGQHTQAIQLPTQITTHQGKE